LCGAARGLKGAIAISQHGLRCNEQIRISPIRLINDLNEQVGIVPTMEALRLAREAGLDLVEVSPMEKPPVCRIMDYGKWKYKQKKKEQKAHAAHVTQLKELRIKSVRIDDHDKTTKLNQAKKFLGEGHKVQFNLMFRGREMAHVDIGRKLMEQFKTDLADISKPEREPKLEGKRMIMILTPKGHSSAPAEKSPAAAAPAPAPARAATTA
jgi:translation initiation factor IF-3